MAKLKCKTPSCDGEVEFNQANDGSGSANGKLRDFALIVVDDKPSECPKCGVSWYEYELEP